MFDDEYLAHLAVADRLREARAEAAASHARSISRTSWIARLRAHWAKRKDTDMNASKGVVVPAGGGQHLDMSAPGRFAALKLRGHETNESVMLFEETVPPGTKSLFHLHHDSDEIAWVLAGEITFKIGDEVSVGGPGTCAFLPRAVPHAWKSTGRETGRVLFLYTPAAAGGYVEELLRRPPGSMSDAERKELRERYRWEIVGPNPL
jgi:mannose-6-phosphate isomerase-like protein (cupin superfamily)